jgi:4-hydroxy-tetrahydrodipicolinate synthase
MKFTGCGTALVTPFQRDESLDERVLRQLIQRQITAGIDFLVPCGTTGESPTLTREEYLRVVEITTEEVRGRVPVLAGAGGNNTAAVVALIRAIEPLGVDGILSVAPCYNKPTHEGLYRHYCTVAEATRLPIVLYNVPGRTGCNIEPETVRRLAAAGSIVGIKEASGNIAQIGAVLQAVPEEFAVLSGDDAMTLPAMALGARGVISVAANEAPAEMTELCRLAQNSDFAAARRIHRRLLPLMDVNFVESNPLPVKAALAMMGLAEPVWRLPLVPPSERSCEKIRGVLENIGLVERSQAVAAVIAN